MISLRESRMFSLAVIVGGLGMLFFAYFANAASEVSGARLAEEYLKKGNKAYIDGDYDQAIIFLAQAVTLAPERSEAVERLKLVVEQKQMLENNASYQDFVKQTNDSESEKTRQFMERMKNAQEVLQLENNRKMLELKLDNDKTITGAVARQDSIIELQDKKVERMRLITSFSFLVMGIFVILNIYLLV
jgi:tetratricopeptide (TPR) repeat protein